MFLLLKLGYQGGKAALFIHFLLAHSVGANLWEAKHTRPPWIIDWTLGGNPN